MAPNQPSKMGGGVQVGDGTQQVLQQISLALQQSSPSPNIQTISLGGGNNIVIVDGQGMQQKSDDKVITLDPDELDIEFGDVTDIWKWEWISRNSPSFSVIKDHANLPISSKVHVARFEEGNWLAINGEADISKLKSDIKYEVCFIVMLEKNDSGWDGPFSLKLKTPTMKDFVTQDKSLKDVPLNKWETIVIGEFTPTKTGGKVEFQIVETDKDNKGFIIKGVVIRPVGWTPPPAVPSYVVITTGGGTN